MTFKYTIETGDMERHWAYWYALEAANGHDYTRSGNSETGTRTYQ